jgi:hypothetical protein
MHGLWFRWGTEGRCGQKGLDGTGATVVRHFAVNTRAVVLVRRVAVTSSTLVQSMARKFLYWHGPRWSYITRRKREVDELKRSVSWRRVACIGGILCVVTFGAICWARGELVIPTLANAITMGVLSVLLVLVLWCSIWAPPSILVARHFVFLDSQKVLLSPSDIVAAELIQHSGKRNRLKLRVQRRMGRRTRLMVFSIGIPPRIDLDELAELLPRRPVVKDARERRIGAKQEVE